MTNGNGGGARRHHYVPQCYLKRFTSTGSKKAQIFVLDAQTQRSFVTTPQNVAAERDFNRIELDGEDPNLIESSYAEFEARVAPALVRTDARGSFTDDADKALILELVAILAVRNPGRREAMRRFQEETHRRMMELLVADQGRWETRRQRAMDAGFVDENNVTFEQARDFVERGDFTIEVPTTTHVQQELRSLTVVYNLLQDRSWVVLRAAPESGGFVTSDHPVTLFWNDPEIEGVFFPPGFGHRDTSVFCPISKNLAIRGCFDDREGTADMPAEIVAAINQRTIFCAGRQVYAENERFRFIDQDGVLRHGRDLLTLLTEQ
ncbi:hypothetical protein AWB82_01801 [Caballeronia glebae]|uniref:DUF4238 domain-containing protein n=1 Tax=Caballeronia glebae TaxID=1777143 RepID=A0A158A6D1_9BURK|nr:DUF4238 domain-containing protein [Caballeronia glebae]SAK53330.1 hypothetical protein AWB82_01801 [Caballeronia glebae]